jgi:PAS domain S-box-containing protein
MTDDQSRERAMQPKPPHPPPATDLRRRAEARLREKGTAARRPIKKADLRRLLHELQVHQIELELQNEELQRAHGELEALLMKYTALYDFAPTGYFTLDREGTIRGLNLAGASLLGTERSKLLNRRFDLLIAAEKRPAFTAFLSHAFESGTKEVCETLLQPEGNPPRWVWIEACEPVSGPECHLTVIDVTGRKTAETDRARLERLVQAASEREQQWIGESLQEDLCQRLAGIEAATAALAKALKRKGRSQSSLADDIAAQAHESLEHARRFADVLQPVSLLEQGLVAAIGHLAAHMQENSGIPCDFKGEDLPHIAAADATHLYRIAQEALNNAVQHAAASQIDVGLSRSGRGFTLTIADDGSGMVEASDQGLGLGLQIMRYRSDLLGAALTIQSKPGRGTVVMCCYHVAGREQRPVTNDQ